MCYACAGQARQAGAAGHRRAVREEAQGHRGLAEDVSPPSLPSLSSATDRRPPASAHSTQTNHARLQLLQQRDAHLADLFARARASVARLAGDRARYARFVEGVVLQGFLQLVEREVVVLARPSDVGGEGEGEEGGEGEGGVVGRAAERAARRYEEISGRTVKWSVVGELSDDM